MDKYYIWSWEHMAWWGRGGNGYTEDLDEAGIYTEEEAGDITLGHIPPGEEVSVLEAWAKKFGKPPNFKTNNNHSE